ncbi:hypothetical protein P4O66_003213 [Electrophorus voltai]|uniref:Uncharacterized protein n=1 Tax=Electrophorus voltai TaxID=2609070 RepID=A0AAD8YS85_9TELE|nr:hypothetical protein P4O66_003213 [Electrophorus voltai]
MTLAGVCLRDKSPISACPVLTSRGLSTEVGVGVPTCSSPGTIDVNQSKVGSHFQTLEPSAQRSLVLCLSLPHWMTSQLLPCTLLRHPWKKQKLSSETIATNETHRGRVYKTPPQPNPCGKSSILVGTLSAITTRESIPGGFWGGHGGDQGSDPAESYLPSLDYRDCYGYNYEYPGSDSAESYSPPIDYQDGYEDYSKDQVNRVLYIALHSALNSLAWSLVSKGIFLIYGNCNTSIARMGFPVAMEINCTS